MAVAVQDPTEPRSDLSSSDAGTQLAKVTQYQSPVLDVIRQHVNHEPHGPEAWQQMPALPTAAEILAGPERHKLPINHIDLALPSKNSYLETHYRLLRREGTEPLRAAVNKYKLSIAASDDEDMCIYTNVRIIGYLMTRQGPLCRISFATDRAKKKIVWQQSRRLLPGSVLAVSTKRDNFETICMTATVAQRPIAGGLDQNPPQVDIVWGSLSDYVVDPDMELIMVEARSGYFEAVRHTLVGLQMAADTDSPLLKYPVAGDKSDALASFIREKPLIDLSPCLYPNAPKDKVEWLRKYDGRDIVPDIRDHTSMDETQIHALYRMVTKELCIVQGPPGTGKTFTSVEALKVILANQGPNAPPVIVAAQTNHALDQLLTLCLDAGAQIARVGGRTESVRIEEYTMFNLRQKFGGSTEQLFSNLDARRRRACGELRELTTAIFNDGLLHPLDLLNTGVITQQQYESLVDDDMEQTAKHLEHGPFSLWISGECIETKVLRNKYCDKKLDGNDADLDPQEYEFEDDLEDMAVDDEDERIFGTFIPFSYKWTGKEPAHLTAWHKRAARELNKSDLYAIPKNMRGAVYQLLFERFIEKLKPKFTQCFADYIDCCKEVKAVRWLRDSNIVKQLQVNIVGCTTTGLTKYRGFLAGLGAKTMLIEEAAETRESNITSALYPSLQQLILVGDHLQLTPFCNTRWLGEKPFYLDMSMFQRMVDYLNIPYIMLDKQRRMAPEIRAAMDFFYGGLQDHEVARSRKPVPGMGDRRTWLYAHSSQDAVDPNHSRYNSEEADMIVNFFAYLVNNGTDPSQITVLTFYRAQRRVILMKLKHHPLFSATVHAFQVHTVDSYQGEENDIVLLSLVRSPPVDGEPKVGFLANQNRVIVAISRARRGFYIFGNIWNAVHASRESQDIWHPIWTAFKNQKRYDGSRGLPLECQTHGKTIWIKNSSAWGTNTGGCDQRCTFVRDCGHQCTLNCHAMPHEKLRCSQVCGKMLPCGHPCNVWCKNPCNCVCPKFQELKARNQALQIVDEAEMHMELDELLKVEAIGGKKPQITSSNPEDMQMVLARDARPLALPTVAQPRPVVRLDPQKLQQLAFKRGNNTRRQIANGNVVASQPGNTRRQITNGNVTAPQLGNLARQSPRRAGPAIHQPKRNGMKHPSNDTNLAYHQPPKVQPAPVQQVISQTGLEYRQFARDIRTLDQASVEAAQASLAKTEGHTPIIKDIYRPADIIDGRRVESHQSSSPEKEVNQKRAPRIEHVKIIAPEPDVRKALMAASTAADHVETAQQAQLVPIDEPETGDTRVEAWISTLEPLSDTDSNEAQSLPGNVRTPESSVEQQDRGTSPGGRAGADSDATTVDPGHGTANNKGTGIALMDLSMLMDQPTLPAAPQGQNGHKQDDTAAFDLVTLSKEPATPRRTIQKQAADTLPQTSSLDLVNLMDSPVKGETQVRSFSADLATLMDQDLSSTVQNHSAQQAVKTPPQAYAGLDQWLGTLSINNTHKEQVPKHANVSTSHAVASAPKTNGTKADDLLIAL